jgi:ABC-type transport system substrate-binding protein
MNSGVPGSPLSGIALDGDKALFGWPNIPEVEAEIIAWYSAISPEEENTIARRLNKAALDNLVYAPLGFYLMHYTWRRNITGIAQGTLPPFWGVGKTAWRFTYVVRPQRLHTLEDRANTAGRRGHEPLSSSQA